ncbi:Protein unc-13 D, partial [Orchesella cincta]
DLEKEKRKTISRYQQQGLRVSIQAPKGVHDKKEVRKRLRVSVERYSMPELYVKMICALFPTVKSRENPDSNALIQHLKHVFRLNDLEHAQLIEIARTTKLPQRIVNLEIVEAKNIPAKDTNGLSDPFCVVFVNSRDVAQRTKVMYNTLNPIWRQYFTFKVNDPSRDVLILEVMDYNEEDEPIRDRLKRIKDVKSASTFGILVKELVNARSMQELIGSVRIPVSEISSETVEKWFRLKNHEERGEIYLRMALGYVKSKDTATEEFLQIIHFLLVHELDKDASLETPFYWDEHYAMWSKYILRQFKWQGGLKPKDIVLAKWRAYTTVNAIFPLNANMTCLLLDAVLERMISGDYDSREIQRFWECTNNFLNTIINFLADLHDVLPCPVTVLHTYHMLKSMELINQFLSQPNQPLQGKSPFTKPMIVDRITKAVRDGADKFWVKVISDATHDNISTDQNALYLALERLLRMAQILHEDLRLGIATIHTDFKGILSIDYLWITFQVYDVQFGKMVKYIMEEYTSMLLDPSETEVDIETTMDESNDAVRTGLTVFKLYLAVKNLAEYASLAPENYTEDSKSEFSLKLGYHDWFFHSVATWIDILRCKITKWVKNSINIAESNRMISSDCVDSKLSKTDKQQTKEIPISSSAVDTAQMFLEEVNGYLIYYAAQIFETISKNELKYDVMKEEDIYSCIHQVFKKVCTAINNINYVKEQVEVLTQQLNIPDIIEKIRKLKLSPDVDEYEAKIFMIKSEMQERAGNVIGKIMSSCVSVVLPKYMRILQDVSTEVFSNRASFQKRHSARQFRVLMSFTDEFWIKAVEGIDQKLRIGLEMGKTSEYFKRYSDLLYHLYNLFWPRELEFETRNENALIFEQYEELKTKLQYLEMPFEQLKLNYYDSRYKRQTLTAVSSGEYGVVTIKACLAEKEQAIIVEILNARNLKGCDSTGLSDPYVVVTVVPKDYYPNVVTYQTKSHKQTLFPIFDETFKIKISTDEIKKGGFLMLTLFDYDYVGRDDLLGEAFLPVSALKKIPSSNEVVALQQVHLVLSKPTKVDDEDILVKFNERTWDREAAKFAKTEREKIEP